MARLKNIRQEAFCQAYSKSGNATEAYKEAGYQCKTDEAARANAARLITNANVCARLKELGDTKENRKIADANEQKEFATAVVRGELSDRDGKPVPMSVRLKALELLGKMQGLYVNHVETNLSVQPVVIRDDLGEADA